MGYRNRSTVNGEIIASWVSSDQEWRSFYNWERRQRKYGIRAWLEVAAVIIAGTLLFRITWPTGWITGLLFSLPLAVIYAILKYSLIAASIGVVLLKTNVVVITNTGVFVNGKFNPFRSESRQLKGVEINEQANPKVLTIIYDSFSSKGATSDKISVPIPRGRLGEAVKLLSILEK
jgi:hypothetical protein